MDGAISLNTTINNLLKWFAARGPQAPGRAMLALLCLEIQVFLFHSALLRSGFAPHHHIACVPAETNEAWNLFNFPVSAPMVRGIDGLAGPMTSQLLYDCG